MSSTRLLIGYGLWAVMAYFAAGHTNSPSRHVRSSHASVAPQMLPTAADGTVFAHYAFHAAHANQLAPPGHLGMSAHMMHLWRPYYGYPRMWPMGWPDTDQETHAHRYPLLLMVPVREHAVTPRVIQFDKDGNISSDATHP